MLGTAVLGSGVLGAVDSSSTIPAIDGAQTHGAQTQSSSLGVVATFSAAQTHGGQSQSTSSGVVVAFTGSQTHGSQSQSTAAGVVVTFTGAQTHGGQLQSGSLSAGGGSVNAAQVHGAYTVGQIDATADATLGSGVLGAGSIVGSQTLTIVLRTQNASMNVVDRIDGAQTHEGQYQIAGLGETYPPTSHSYIIW